MMKNTNEYMKDHMFELQRKIFFIIYVYITNSYTDQFPDGLIAQVIENCTGIAEVMGSTPVQA